MPSYFDWLINEADMAPTYRWHHGFLQLLAAAPPGRAGRGAPLVRQVAAREWAFPLSWPSTPTCC